ncbi:MAG: DegT/DnrJ/EryC1/StrS aminotransferase family protein [Planctomycetes bacterium]|nr:DegT/DnrJ/EryC1/StrS aminotransferase family protein [Planctomycetota bacterium]
MADAHDREPRRAGKPLRLPPVPTDRDRTGRSFGDRELRLLGEVLASGALNSNGGSFVPRFERVFANALGSPHAIACSSGSLAVQGCLAALELPSGSEIVTSPITDFGAIAAILFAGLRPRFCDVDPETLMPTEASILAAVTPTTTAVVVTYLFGRAFDIRALVDTLAKRGIDVVEDAAQALGARVEGNVPGTVGALGAFSFQQSKHITSGEGGAIVASTDTLARRARLFVNKAWPYGEPNPDHEFVAPNGRLTELQAAVLLAQLERLESFVEQRRASARCFAHALAERTDRLRFPAEPPGHRHSHWRLHLVASPDLDLDALAASARQVGLPCQAHYVGRPAFDLRAMRDAGFRERIEDFPGVRHGLAQCLVVPWNERIDEELATLLGATLGELAVGCSA